MNALLRFNDELKGRAEMMAIESGLCPQIDDATFDTANFEKFWCLWKHDSRIWLADMSIQAEHNRRKYFLIGLVTGLGIATAVIALTPIMPALKLLLSQ